MRNMIEKYTIRTDQIHDPEYIKKSKGD